MWLTNRFQESRGRVSLFKASSRSDPSFSPDGRWLAYSNAEGGRDEVYVRAFPDTGTQVQISNDGGTLPLVAKRA